MKTVIVKRCHESLGHVKHICLREQLICRCSGICVYIVLRKGSGVDYGDSRKDVPTTCPLFFPLINDRLSRLFGTVRRGRRVDRLTRAPDGQEDHFKTALIRQVNTHLRRFLQPLY